MKRLKEAYLANNRKLFEEKCFILKSAGIEFETKVYKRDPFSFRQEESEFDHGLYYIYVDKKDLDDALEILL